MLGREAVFFHEGRSYKFLVEEEAPEIMMYARRSCPTGPVTRLELKLLSIEHGTAIYQVISTGALKYEDAG